MLVMPVSVSEPIPNTNINFRVDIKELETEEKLLQDILDNIKLLKRLQLKYVDYLNIKTINIPSSTSTPITSVPIPITSVPIPITSVPIPITPIPINKQTEQNIVKSTFASKVKQSIQKL